MVNWHTLKPFGTLWKVQVYYHYCRNIEYQTFLLEFSSYSNLLYIYSIILNIYTYIRNKYRVNPRAICCPMVHMDFVTDQPTNQALWTQKFCRGTLPCFNLIIHKWLMHFWNKLSQTQETTCNTFLQRGHTKLKNEILYRVCSQLSYVITFIRIKLSRIKITKHIHRCFFLCPLYHTNVKTIPKDALFRSPTGMVPSMAKNLSAFDGSLFRKRFVLLPRFLGPAGYRWFACN